MIQPPADIIQKAQSTILKLQASYLDSQPAFWALAVAWEATRFAWYVVAGDHNMAMDKLQLLKRAIADFENHS